MGGRGHYCSPSHIVIKHTFIQLNEVAHSSDSGRANLCKGLKVPLCLIPHTMELKNPF